MSTIIFPVDEGLTDSGRIVSLYNRMSEMAISRGILCFTVSYELNRMVDGRQFTLAHTKDKSVRLSEMVDEKAKEFIIRRMVNKEQVDLNEFTLFIPRKGRYGILYQHPRGIVRYPMTLVQLIKE